ncbi:MAG: hypothetical protein ACTSUK_03895 [Promethearchaeota archaeon]
MEINGKKYEISTEISLGILYKLYKNPSMEDINAFLKQVLKPTPSQEEIEEITIDQFMEISSKFQEKLQKRMVSLKKKLSP